MESISGGTQSASSHITASRRSPLTRNIKNIYVNFRKSFLSDAWFPVRFLVLVSVSSVVLFREIVFFFAFLLSLLLLLCFSDIALLSGAPRPLLFDPSGNLHQIAGGVIVCGRLQLDIQLRRTSLLPTETPLPDRTLPETPFWRRASGWA
jgi:hypothetical protein